MSILSSGCSTSSSELAMALMGGIIVLRPGGATLPLRAAMGGLVLRAPAGRTVLGGGTGLEATGGGACSSPPDIKEGLGGRGLPFDERKSNSPKISDKLESIL